MKGHIWVEYRGSRRVGHYASSAARGMYAIECRRGDFASYLQKLAQTAANKEQRMLSCLSDVSFCIRDISC